MVTRPLHEFLRQNTITHPTTVREVRVTHGNVVLEIVGYPWWRTSDEVQEIEEASAKIELLSISRTQLTESCLTNDPFNEDLEHFDVTDLALAPWNKGNSAEVFCSEPLKEPIALLSSLEEFLTEAECPFLCTEFMNAKTVQGMLSEQPYLTGPM